MNLPNKLTILRVLLIPFCLILIYFRLYVLGGIVFLIACFTDFLDGQIARKNGLVTNFGKFADPVADKILVLSIMVILLARGRYPWWTIVIVLVRELMVDGFRLIALEKGRVIPAGILGKIKTSVQMISILIALWTGNQLLTDISAFLVAFLTVASGYVYFNEVKAYLSPKEGGR